MAKANREIVVNIVSDASKFLKGYEQAISELEKYSKKANIASGMQQQIDELKDDIIGLSTALKKISTGEIDVKQLDNLGKKLDSQAEKIKKLQQDSRKIKIQVDETSGKKINDIVNQAENIVSQLIEKVQTLNKLGINIHTESIKNNSDEIQKLSNRLNELNLQQEKLSKGSNFSNLSTKEAIAKLQELQKQSSLAYDELSKLKNNSIGRNNKIIEIGQIAKDIQTLQNQLKDTSELKIDLIDEDFLQDDINNATKLISQLSTTMQSKLRELTSTTNIETSSLQLKDGKISVQLDIDTTAAKLRQQAQALVQQVQTEIWKTPLMVPLKFTSSYVTKAQDELKGIEDTINSMGNSKKKTVLVSQLENLKKQLKERDFKIEFKTNISELETDINKGLQAVQTSLKNARLYLYPEVTLDEESKKKIQTALNDICKNLQLDLSQLGLNIEKLLGEEDRKKIQESLKDLKIEITPNIKLTDKDITNINNKLTQQLSKLKVEIDFNQLQESLKKALDVALIDNWKNQFIFTIDAICQKIESSLQQSISTAMTSLSENSKSDSSKVQKQSKNGSVDTNNEEVSQLINLLNQMSTSLNKINKKNFKFDTQSIDLISNKLESLLSVLKELNTQVHNFDFSNVNLSVEPIEQIVSAFENLSNMFQRAFNVSSDTDISNQWVKLQEQFNSFAKQDGNFDSRKKEVSELIKEYQKYLDMGGKNPIDDLTDNKKGKSKLSNQYNKYIESQKKAAQESAKAIEVENKALEKTEKSAKKSAQAKADFTKANQGVKKSAEQSSQSIQEEVREFQNAESVIKHGQGVGDNVANISSSSQEQEIIKQTGIVATDTANLVKQAEDTKQQEYQETANALEVLQKAQVGTADIFKRTQEHFDFTTDPNLKAKAFFEEYANSIAQAEGLSESKYVINTDANQNFKSATIEYYNEALKQTITETWLWHEANQKVEGDTDRMVVSNIKFVDNIRAKYEQTRKDNEKMATALQKAQEALTSFDSKTQGKLKDNATYKELSDLLSNGFKNIEDVERAKQLMNELNVQLNNINADARKGSASFDIFSNMVKGINEADNKVRLLTIEFQSLKDVPDTVRQKFEALWQSLSTLKNAEGVENQAKAYGEYREALNEATYALQIFKKEQSLSKQDEKERQNVLKEIISLTEKIASKEAKIKLLDTKTDLAEIQQLQSEIDLLQTKLNDKQILFGDLNGYANLDTTTISELATIWGKVETAEQKALDKQAFEKAKQDYNELKRILTEIVSVKEKLAKATINGDSFSIDSFTKQLSILENTASNLESSLFSNLKGLDVLNIDDLNKLTAIFDSFDTKLAPLKDKQLGNLESLLNQLNSAGLLTDDLSQKFKELAIELNSVSDNSGLENWSNKFQQLQSQFPKELINGFEKIGLNFANLPDGSGKIDLYSQKVNAIISSITSLRQSITQLNVDDDTLYTDGVLDADKYNQKIQEILKSITTLKQEANKYNLVNTEGRNRGDILTNTIGQLEERDVKGVTQALREYAVANELGKETGIKSNDLDTVSIAFKNQEGVITKLTGKLITYTDESGNAVRAVRMLKDESQGAVGLFGNFGAVLKKFAGYFSMYFTGYAMVTKVLTKFREGIEIVKEFDAAMTELIKVSNETEAELYKFESQAFDIASTIGSTGKEIVNSAADWEKLGYAIDEASELARNSAIYANVGDMDIDTATEHMVSTLKAFNIEASNSITIVDKFNEIGNNYAITSEGIGAALERSAASLVAAGKIIA